MKIIVNAKSVPKTDEFLAKVNVGFKNIEIQLLEKEVTKQQYEDTDNIIKDYGVDIRVVHSPILRPPLVDKITDVVLIRLLDRNFFDTLVDTCKYAEHIAELEGHRVKIVVHNDTSEDMWRITNLIETSIGPKIKDITDFFSNIDFVIENTGTIANCGFNTIFGMSDIAYVVNELNKFAPGRIMPLMDTCHMMMSYESWKRVSYEDLTDWKKEFKDATQYCDFGLIHLNNMRDNGIDADHSRPFSIDEIDDMKKLKEIMKNYRKYSKCEITIEVNEDDYTATPVNLLKTKEALETIGFKLITEKQ